MNSIELDPAPSAGQGLAIRGDQAGVIEKVPTRRTRTVVRDQVNMIEIAAGVILKGGGPMQIARRLRCPYPTAAKLHDRIYEEVMGRIQDDYDPEVLKALKREKRELLLREIHRCELAVARSFKDGKPNTRPYAHINTAVRLLNGMDGHNAQELFESHNLHIVADRELHNALFANPEYQALMLRMEAIERDTIARKQGLTHPQT